MHYALLMQMRPRKIFVITDAGRDHDDELAFALLAGLQLQGKCEVVGAIANLHPTDLRARLVKGAFQSLGLDVPVAAGIAGEPDHTHKPYEFAVPYLAAAEAIEADGQALLARVFEAADRNGEQITLLLISGMMDADQFLTDQPELAQRVLDQVVIMGDVKIAADGAPIIEDGRLVPGKSYNNSVDRHLNVDPDGDPVGPAAKRLYATLQDRQIPTTVLSRYTAYAAAVSPDYYEQLRDTGHPMGVRLQADQRHAIEGFWHDIRTGRVAPRLTEEWFANVYCGGGAALDALRADPDQPWHYVIRLNLFDPLAALAAVCPHGLFAAEEGASPASRSFKLIGVNPATPNIADYKAVRHLLDTLPLIGLTGGHPPVQPQQRHVEQELAPPKLAA